MIDLQSAKNTIASADTPNLAQGGVSSSTALNKIHGNIRSDLMSLDLDTKELLEDITDLVTVASQQAAALSIAYNTLSSDIANMASILVSGSPHQTRVTMFDPTFTADQVTTVSVNRKFGQATLPIAGETNWFSTKDMEGNTYIPDQTNLRVCFVESLESYQDLQEYQYWNVENYQAAFDQNEGSVWYQDTLGSTYIAIRLDVPVNLITGLSANALELCPFPVLAHDLVDITLLLNNGTTSTLDLSEYSTPGYDSVSSTIKSFGNLRFFFAPAQVQAITLLIKLNAGYNFVGFTDVSLKTLHFDKSGILSLDLSEYADYLYSINMSKTTAALVGDNQTYLTDLALASTSDFYTIVYNITQLAAGLTPVITAVDILWN